MLGGPRSIYGAPRPPVPRPTSPVPIHIQVTVLSLSPSRLTTKSETCTCSPLSSYSCSSFQCPFFFPLPFPLLWSFHDLAAPVWHEKAIQFVVVAYCFPIHDTQHSRRLLCRQGHANHHHRLHVERTSSASRLPPFLSLFYEVLFD